MLHSPVPVGQDRRRGGLGWSYPVGYYVSYVHQTKLYIRYTPRQERSKAKAAPQRWGTKSSAALRERAHSPRGGVAPLSSDATLREIRGRCVCRTAYMHTPSYLVKRSVMFSPEETKKGRRPANFGEYPFHALQ